MDTVHLGPSPHAVFLRDSSLVLGDGSDLLRLSPDGRQVTRLGRRGDGPGEFRWIGGVKLAGGERIVVNDLVTGRITVMLPSGKTLRIVPHLPGAESGREIDLVTALPDGQLISTYWQDRPNRGDLEGIPVRDRERDPVPLVLHDSAGVRLRVLGQWLGLERARVSFRGDAARLPLPHARSVMYASRDDVTVISPTDSLDVSLFVGATVVARIVSPLTGPSPTRRDAGAWRDAVLDWDAALGPPTVSAMSKAPPVPALPSIGPLSVDGDRQVWIGSYVGPGKASRQWRIISPAGRPVGIVELPALSNPIPILPARSEILDVYGDRLALLVQYDGVPAVEVRRIMR